MSSTFDEKNELQSYEDCFQNASALYAALQNEARPRAIRRAVLNQAGEVTAEAIDFCADYELKAKRILNPTQYRLVLRFAREDKYDSVPKTIQQELGSLFLKSDMNYDGAYRILFFKAKNSRLQDRDEPQHFPEEVME